MNTSIILVNLVFTLLLSLLSLVPSYFLSGQGIKNNRIIFFISSFALGILCHILKVDGKSYISYYITLITLISCAYIDKMTKTIPEYYHVIVLISALIKTELSDLPWAIIALSSTFICLLILSKFAYLGGADVKMMACLAFSLKIKIAFFIFFTFLAFAIYSYIKNIKNAKRGIEKQTIPLFPFMVIPYFITIFI